MQGPLLLSCKLVDQLGLPAIMVKVMFQLFLHMEQLFTLFLPILLCGFQRHITLIELFTHIS